MVTYGKMVCVIAQCYKEFAISGFYIKRNSLRMLYRKEQLLTLCKAHTRRSSKNFKNRIELPFTTIKYNEIWNVFRIFIPTNNHFLQCLIIILNCKAANGKTPEFIFIGNAPRKSHTGANNRLTLKMRNIKTV